MASKLELLDRLVCSICKQVLNEPATLTCGHSLCKACLENQPGIQQCPKCQAPVGGAVEVNHGLLQIINELKDEVRNEVIQGANRDVECDVCTTFKLKAVKSCLVCLSSYCSIHVKNHQTIKRLRPHQLVSPVRDLNQRACEEHGRPLEFYNSREKRFVCVHCVRRFEDLVLICEESNKKRAQIKEKVSGLNKEKACRHDKMKEFHQAFQSSREELINEITGIEEVFNNIMTTVEETRKRLLQPLIEKKKSLEEEGENHRNEFKSEVDILNKQISDLEAIGAIDDSLDFLLSCRSEPVNHQLKDWTNINWDTTLSFGSMRTTTTNMMENVKSELEKLTPIEIQRVSKFSVDVQMDPTTAHRRLAVSEDRRSVRDSGENQGVAEGPQRFDTLGSTLGVRGITSGRCYWEVEVSKKTGWELGVAQVDANRQGNLNLTPDSGYWVVAHYDKQKFAALASPPLRLLLSKKPEKVGMFVDYEEGLVSFYNLTNQSHIHSFTGGSFNGEIKPYFGPHPKKDQENSEPMVISRVHPKEKPWLGVALFRRGENSQ